MRRTCPWLLASAAVLLAASPAFAAGDLELIPELPLMIGLVVLFLLMVIPVNALLLQPLLKILDAREQKIDGTRAHADKLERQATEVLDRYETSIREVREESEQKRRGLLDTARNESNEVTGAARAASDATVKQARREVSAALEEARSGLRGQAEELAKQAAAQVLGRSL